MEIYRTHEVNIIIRLRACMGNDFVPSHHVRFSNALKEVATVFGENLYLFNGNK